MYSSGTSNPFEIASQNNQVILVPNEPLELHVHWKADQPPSIERHRLLFAVYQPRSDNPETSYRWTRFTSTTWDGGTANPNQPNDPATNYYVPTSCIQCHGGTFPNARLNLLDTDYSVWRSQDLQDYPGLSRFKWWTGNSTEWWQGDVEGFQFDAFRTLNNEILTQNQQADGANKPPQSQTEGIQSWLHSHPDNLDAVPPERRGWNGQHGELVGLLVKYCSRCHGTVGYSVLNPNQVRENADWMADRIASEDPEERMPQDRIVFPADAAEKRTPGISEDLKRLQKLLRELEN